MREISSDRFFSLKIIIFVVSLFIRHENQNLSVCIDLSYLFYSELLINERCLKVCILIWSKICESRGVHYDITAQNIGRIILLPFQEQQRKFKMKKQLCTLFEFQRDELRMERITSSSEPSDPTVQRQTNVHITVWCSGNRIKDTKCDPSWFYSVFYRDISSVYTIMILNPSHFHRDLKLRQCQSDRGFNP